MNDPLSVNVISDTLMMAYTGMVGMLFALLPRLFASLLILVLGLLIAKWIRTGVAGFLQAIKIDRISQHPALSVFMKQLKLELRFEQVVAEIAYWLVLIVFVTTAVNTLGLTTVSDFIVSILTYLPRVLSAVLIFILGVVVAGFVESFSKKTISRINPTSARYVGKAASYTVVIFTSLIAISEIGIAKSYIQILFVGIVATMSLGMGLALGLGAKDIVAKLLEDWYKENRKK